MSQQQLVIPLYDLINCISDSIDLVNPRIISHHKRVTYIALSLAKHLGCSDQECDNLFIAGQLHDIGAIAGTMDDASGLLNFDIERPHFHSLVGYLLLKKFEQFACVANIVKYHHVPWDRGKGRFFLDESVPELSHIIHLADRVDILINNQADVIDQIDRIRKVIRQRSDETFKPELVEAFMEVSNKEAFWFDIVSPGIRKIIPSVHQLKSVYIKEKEVINISNLISHLIDFRSRFTATHSSGVAACAAKLGELAGMSTKEIIYLKISGFLHDLGKMAVPKEILEKEEQLTDQEFNIIRKHSYLTRRILDNVPYFKEVNRWASSHHEQLNGKGYPFRLDESELDTGTRIIAVADIFTALLEDRPYRKGMSQAEVTAILQEAVERKAIDRQIVDLLLLNFEEINQIRTRVQEEATEDYNKFWNDVEQFCELRVND